MKREYRVLSKLYRVFPLAPRSYLFCDDHSIIGADFQVMERRRGIVIRKRIPQAINDQPELKRRIGEMVVDVLIALHKVDRQAGGRRASLSASWMVGVSAGARPRTKTMLPWDA